VKTHSVADPVDGVRLASKKTSAALNNLYLEGLVRYRQGVLTIPPRDAGSSYRQS